MYRYFIKRAIIHVSFTVLHSHQFSSCLYIHPVVRMSKKSNLNCNNNNNNRNDDGNDCDDARTAFVTDDTVDWKVHRRPRQKKSSRHHISGVTDSRTRRKGSTNDTATAPEWMMKLPFRIPPSSIETTTPSTLYDPQPQHQQHILLLVGLPGSGKTVLATTLCRILPWKYSHVNQDLLQSRPACLRETQRILDMGKCPIIDRCNISKRQRQYFTQFTTASSLSSSATATTTNSTTIRNNTQASNDNYVPVDCVVLQSASVQECIQRCKQRMDHPTLPPHQVQRVIGIMQHEWEEPKTFNPTGIKQASKSYERLRSVSTIQNDAKLQQWMTNLIETATSSTIINGDDTHDDTTVPVDRDRMTAETQPDTRTTNLGLIQTDEEEEPDEATVAAPVDVLVGLDTLTIGVPDEERS